MHADQSQIYTVRFAVVGNPVEHSLSPDIHSMFADQLGIALAYERLLASKDNFAHTVSSFFEQGGMGLNITVPFKGDAFSLCDSKSPETLKSRAINTISSRDGDLTGFNTDGAGMVRDISLNLGQKIARKHILLLGAGGAIRGVTGPLLEEKPASVTIVNRTRERAEKLASLYPEPGGLTVRDIDELGDKKFDIIINGTAASLEGTSLSISPGTFEGADLVYDMMYGPAASRFTRLASACGARRVSDGLGMLIEQAAESFRIWHGIRPDTAPVHERLRPVSQRQRGS